jgi:hypothetical protein
MVARPRIHLAYSVWTSLAGSRSFTVKCAKRVLQADDLVSHAAKSNGRIAPSENIVSISTSRFRLCGPRNHFNEKNICTSNSCDTFKPLTNCSKSIAINSSAYLVGSNHPATNSNALSSSLVLTRADAASWCKCRTDSTYPWLKVGPQVNFYDTAIAARRTTRN